MKRWARHFDTSISFAVNLMALSRETVGPATPDRRQEAWQADPAEKFLLAFVERGVRRDDVQLARCAARGEGHQGDAVIPVALWLIKKASVQEQLPGIRTRPARPPWARLNWKNSREPVMRRASATWSTFIDETGHNQDDTAARALHEGRAG